MLERNVCPNRLKREFRLHKPLEVFLTDVTYIPYNDNKMAYGSAVIDSVTGRLMSFRISDTNDLKLAECSFVDLSESEHCPNALFHSDQGSVYASKAFNDLLPMYVNRSMSRAGTPTDNAAMESINGWIKAELFMDFHVTGEKPVEKEIDDYIVFFNEQRPAYSLNYLTPKQYREAHAA